MGNDNQNETANQNEQVQTQEQPTVNENQTTEQPKESELLKQNTELQIELRKQKKMIDEYSSQISKLKKQIADKTISESEKASQQTEEIAEIKEKLEKAERNIAFRDTVDGYLALGMDKDFATKVAQLKMDGEEDLVNTSLRQFLDSERKRVKEETTAELYASMPAPVSGNGDGQIDYKKISEENSIEMAKAVIDEVSTTLKLQESDDEFLKEIASVNKAGVGMGEMGVGSR